MVNLPTVQLHSHGDVDAIVRAQHGLGFVEPTVAVVLANPSMSAIGLVQPTADTTGYTWIPPQGRILESETLREGAYRELEEELGIAPSDIHDMWYVASGVNKLPTERAKEGRRAKGLHYMLVHISTEKIRPVAPENLSFQWVYSLDDLRRCMQGARPVKQALTLAVLSNLQPHLQISSTAPV